MRLGATDQPAQDKAPTVEEIAFEQRTRGSYTFRYATPAWYAFTMAIAKKWRTGPPIEVLAATDPPTKALSAQLIPSSMETEEEGLSSAYDWIKQAQAEGWGVVLLPDGGAATVVKTKRAEVAERLTEQLESNFVLSEPRAGWSDVMLASPAWALAVFALVGFAGSLIIMEGLK